MNPQEPGTVDVADEIVAFKERMEREAAALKERLDAERAALRARLAKLDEAAAIVVVPVEIDPPMSPARSNGARANGHGVHTNGAAMPKPEDAEISPLLRKKLRGARVADLVLELLALRNGQSFSDLRDNARKIKKVSDGSLHNALSRLKNEKIRFKGERPNTIYWLLREGEEVPDEEPAPRAWKPDTDGEEILRTLRERPGRPIKEIALALYDDDSEEGMERVWRKLNSLKKHGLVENPERGKWEVVAQS
jgi:hypothetical protein